MSFPSVVAAKRRRYIRKFRDANAVSPKTAIDLRQFHIHHGLTFKKFNKQGIFVEVAVGRYYLNEAKELELRKKRRSIALIALLFISLVFLAGYFSIF